MSDVATKQKSIPSLFTDFFGRDIFNDEFFTSALGNGKNFPAANVKEKADRYEVELSAPGFEKSNFSIRLEDDVLHIEARKEEEKKEENERYTRREFRSDSFIRSFRLPRTVHSDRIDASYENGILKLTVPKKPEAVQGGSREIKIS